MCLLLPKTRGGALLHALEKSELRALLVQKYLLYWYKSTCFTGTKVLALMVHKYLLYLYKVTCLLVQMHLLTGTKVQILTPQEQQVLRMRTLAG